MPQVTVYIRKEDITKWKALTKKSEFIHNALNGLVVAGVQEATLKDAMIPVKPIKPPLKQPETGMALKATVNRPPSGNGGSTPSSGTNIESTGPTSEFEHFLKQKQGKK